MDRQEQGILAVNGYAFRRVPGIQPQPRAIFYSRDAITGAVVQHNLPADAYSLNHYLQKGFVLNPLDLKPIVEGEKHPPPLLVEKVAAKRHYRKHKKQKREV